MVKLYRIILIGLFYIVPVSLLAQSNTTEDQLDTAAQAYEAADYQTAIELYQGVIADGFTNAAILHNLGNSYYESNQLGHALLNYRRAQRLEARDSEISQRIALIRAQRADFQRDEVYWLDRLASSTISTLTLVELTYITLILWCASFGLLAFLIVTRRTVINLTLGIIGGVTLILFVLLVSRSFVETQRPAAIVVALSTEVFSGPGTGYLAMFELFSAAEARVIGQDDEWTKIQLPDGRQGWVNSLDIETI